MQYTLGQASNSRAEIISYKTRTVNIENDKRSNRIKQLLLRLKFKVKRIFALGLTVNEIYDARPFPTKPYEREQSEPFIKAAKVNNLRDVKKLIMLSKYLVYAFDWSHFTALHWAAKRGHTKVCEFLLEKGADPNALDSMDKTPFYYALTQNHVDCAYDLVMHGAVLPEYISFKKLQSCNTHFMIIKLVKLMKEAKYATFLIWRKESKRQVEIVVKQRIKDLYYAHQEECLKNNRLLIAGVQNQISQTQSSIRM